MWIADIFKLNQYKKHISDLENKISEYESLFTPEVRDAQRLKSYISDLQNDISNKQESIKNLDSLISSKHSELSDIIHNLTNEIEEKKQQIISLDDDLLIQSVGLYNPTYDFLSVEEYKESLSKIRADQASMVRAHTAATGAISWTVNGSASEGKRMVNDMQRLLLRAFNNECDDIVSKVRYNNFDASVKRIDSSCDSISKLGKIMDVSISPEYRQLKLDELKLALEYQIKKHEEAERIKELRAQQREEAKLKKEIEEQRKKAEKEEQHYLKALSDIEKQIQSAGDTVDQSILDRRKELEEKLGCVQEDLRTIDYRVENQKAGYVYIISNIGAFGEDVYKIGMTRRLDPKERIDELSDASVPFNFDIHAMIFTEDAPKLEAALHKAFEDRKLNMVNLRREFFHVTLDEIKSVIRENFDKTVEFIDIPDAEQYRISEKIRADMNSTSSSRES